MCEWYHFLIALFLLTFSISSIFIGLLAVYFSSGKTRILSIVFLLIGLIFLTLFLWCSWCIPVFGTPPIELCGCITKGVAAFFGGLIGIICSIGFILMLILKS